jgi:Carboxypeptidase regulatory-like domain
MRKLLVVLFAALLVASMTTVANAQRLDGSLRVEVTDSTGASVPGAKVTVTNENTTVSISISKAEGTYFLPNLLVGSYTVVVEKEGFKKYVRKGIMVESNQVAEAKVKLEIGEVTTVVEVTSGADMVKTTTSELGETFGGREVNEVPIGTIGGSVLELAVGLPNTTTQQGGVLGSGGSIGGTRPRFNSFSIDGVDDNRADVTGPITPVIQDSVAEFTLLTNQFNAEYGHSAGGQFIITTKSGTNSWHGEGHEYNRNRNYDAANNQEKDRIKAGTQNDKDRFDYNRAGASIGGPIIKNRLFIFGAYEFQNEGLAANSPTATLPTAAGLATLTSLAAHQTVKDILKQFPVAPSASGTVTVNGTVIPVGQFQSIAPAFQNQHDFITNGDLKVGKHQISTRFLYDRFRAPDFNADLPQSQFLGTNAFDARKAIVKDTWSVTSRFVNDFRTSYSRNVGPALIVPSTFANFPNVGIDDLGINLGPDGNAPQSYTQNVYQIADTMTYVKGRHTLRWGAEWRHWIAPTNFLPRARGEWDYATLQTLVNDLVPDGGNGALRGAGSGLFAGNNNAVYWFVQNDLRVSSRLVLNMGLRYEYSGVVRDANLQAGNAIADDPNFGIFFRAPKPDTNNFAPRFGFAYDPFGNGKWAIRGGAGLAFDTNPINFVILQLPPQFQSEQNPQVTCALSGAPAWCTNPSAGFLQTGGLLQVNVPPTNQADARAATQGLIVDQTAPKVLTWTLSVQHELFKDTSVEVRYLGTHSMSLPVQTRLNERTAFDPSIPGGGLAPLPTFFKASDVPATFPLASQRRSAFVNFVNNGLFQPLAVDGFFSVFTTFQPTGQSIYHSGSVDVLHRFSHGFYIRGNYTYEKNIDNATNELFSSRVNPRRPQDPFNMRNERGRSVLDLTHKFAMSWVYDVPKLHAANALVKGFLHGWSVSGSYLAQTGQPITALSGTDSNANGSSAGDRTILNPNGVGLTGSGVNFVCINSLGASSIVTSTGACSGGSANVVGYVAKDATATFIQAGLGAKANVGRNTVPTPGLNIWNVSLLKSTKITERFNIQFRAETYDTFNHRNFSIGLPTNNGAIDQTTNPNPLSTGYPFVTAKGLFLNNQQFNGGSRTMQLGLKFIF